MKFTYKFPIFFFHSPSNSTPCFILLFLFLLISWTKTPLSPPSKSIQLILKMTNPNVVVSDTQSAIAMALTVATNGYSPPLSNPPPHGYPYNLTLFPKSKFPKSLEAKNIAWAEAMRASSPTRNSSSSEDTEHKKAWIVSSFVFFLSFYIVFGLFWWRRIRGCLVINIKQ